MKGDVIIKPINLLITIVPIIGTGLSVYFTNKQQFLIATIVFILLTCTSAWIWYTINLYKINQTLMLQNKQLSDSNNGLKENNHGLDENVTRVKGERDEAIAAFESYKLRMTIVFHVLNPDKEQLEQIKLEEELFND